MNETYHETKKSNSRGKEMVSRKFQAGKFREHLHWKMDDRASKWVMIAKFFRGNIRRGAFSSQRSRYIFGFTEFSLSTPRSPFQDWTVNKPPDAAKG